MMRIVAFAVLVLIFFLLIRSFFLSPDQKKTPAAISEMVKDPNCETYVPREVAIVRVIRGASHCFCSEACADEFSKKS